jgi:hypothetical protein
MRFAAVLLLLSSVALCAFAWWGTSTVVGRTRYDEMDGLYPLGAGLLGVLLACIGIVLGCLTLCRRRRET